MRKTKEVTLLQSAIPLDRGVAKHIESKGSLAKTVFGNDGKVKEIHTPGGALRRVHEVLHARHTQVGSYEGIRDEVAQIVEDCRLHLTKWPWDAHDTPKEFIQDADALFDDEEAERNAALKEHGKLNLASDFRQRVRRNAIYSSMGQRSKIRGQSTDALANLQIQVFSYILRGDHEKAAALIEATLYYEEADDREERENTESSENCEDIAEAIARAVSKGPGGKTKPGETGIKPALSKKLHAFASNVCGMVTIHLPLSREIKEDTVGHRLATSGTRIHRPLLRRPIIPQRLFIRRSPVMPGGAILFDSSGSMQVTAPMLKACCDMAPAATIAFYSGDPPVGKLYIYAKDGIRSDVDPATLHLSNGNGCDGKALDWLMAQEGPRIFVTDREFCGSSDAFIQVIRLEKLEREGEVEVLNSFSVFKKRYGKKAAA